jgi:hypothetical protein
MNRNIYVLAACLFYCAFLMGCAGSTNEIFSFKKVGSVRIQIDPEGSEITIDGKSVGFSPIVFQVEDTDGKSYHLAAKKDGYLAIESQFSIFSPQKNEVIGALYQIPLLSFINRKIIDFGWKGEQYWFISNDENSLKCQDGQEIRTIYEFDQNPEWIIAFEEGFVWQAVDQAGFGVYLLRDQLDVPELVTEGYFYGKLNASKDALYLLGYPYNQANGNEEEVLLIRKELYGNGFEWMKFEQVPGWDTLYDFTISKDETYLATNNPILEIWKIENGLMSKLEIDQQWKNAIYSPGDGTKIFVIDKNDTFSVADMSSDEIFYIDSNVKNASWSDDGRRIYYSKDTREGSDSVWKYDLDRKVKVMIADSSIITGPITEIAIKPDGCEIAYINRFGNGAVIRIQP